MAELKELKKSNFKDLWKDKGYGDGFTENTDINFMRWNLKSKAKKFRYDAILYKGSFKPININLIGTEKAFNLDPIDGKNLMEKLIQKIHTPGLSSVKISSSNKNNIFDDDNKINFLIKQIELDGGLLIISVLLEHYN